MGSLPSSTSRKGNQTKVCKISSRQQNQILVTNGPPKPVANSVKRASINLPSSTGSTAALQALKNAAAKSATKRAFAKEKRVISLQQQLDHSEQHRSQLEVRIQELKRELAIADARCTDHIRQIQWLQKQAISNATQQLPNTAAESFQERQSHCEPNTFESSVGRLQFSADQNLISVAEEPSIENEWARFEFEKSVRNRLEGFIIEKFGAERLKSIVASLTLQSPIDAMLSADAPTKFPISSTPKDTESKRDAYESLEKFSHQIPQSPTLPLLRQSTKSNFSRNLLKSPSSSLSNEYNCQQNDSSNLTPLKVIRCESANHLIANRYSSLNSSTDNRIPEGISQLNQRKSEINTAMKNFSRPMTSTGSIERTSALNASNNYYDKQDNADLNKKYITYTEIEINNNVPKNDDDRPVPKPRQKNSLTGNSQHRSSVSSLKDDDEKPRGIVQQASRNESSGSSTGLADNSSRTITANSTEEGQLINGRPLSVHQKVSSRGSKNKGPFEHPPPAPSDWNKRTASSAIVRSSPENVANNSSPATITDGGGVHRVQRRMSFSARRLPPLDLEIGTEDLEHGYFQKMLDGNYTELSDDDALDDFNRQSTLFEHPNDSAHSPSDETPTLRKRRSTVVTSAKSHDSGYLGESSTIGN